MKKRLKILLLIVLLGALIALLFNVKIKNVNYEGLTRYSETELTDKIIKDEFSRISIVFFLRDFLFDHEKYIHIDEYTVSWNSPFTITINVVENPPIAFVKKDIKNIYIDKEAAIYEISDQRKSHIPEVVGLNFMTHSKSEKIEANDTELLDIIVKIADFSSKNSLPIELIDVKNDNEIIVYIGKVKVILGDRKNMIIKINRLKDIYPQIKDLDGTLDLSEAKANMEDEQYIFKKGA